MKTAKPIERYIKKQIDDREINPSRDLWSEIQSQTVNTGSGKPVFNRFLFAACFVLIFGLGSVLFFNKDEKSEAPIVNSVKSPSLETEYSDQSEKINSETVMVPRLQKKLPQNKDNFAESKPEEKVFLKSDRPLIKENSPEIISEITQNPPLKIIAKTDSVKVQNKKRYVDPSTLLFSVEHKDVIEKSKDGSNVATIDLNTK
ncbi:hypothetical protein MKJ01_13560 [Chryseobacterium sp. SSA4.19]|uniref:hypothetical protein n=1 Tax=Chryseobacterium sp. SSA4.19 TaxID=2919915 RepID=UPI001F4EF1F9|nr:hypothetical protein [Chryseobacterium sp. SSA4.19]MCJ8154793.1 hypothetical protein [Chryseobacterium sp. SSA4.19]